MVNWWSSLDFLEQVFAVIAAPSILILTIQTIGLIFGLGGSDSDSDFDVPDDVGGHTDHLDAGLKLFSVRGILAFTSTFGLSGLIISQSGMPKLITLILSTLLGFIALIAIAYLIKWLISLQHSGNLQIKRALGETAEVYLTIPASNKGKGKVNLIIQERLTEFSAVTNDLEAIPTGASVRVTDILENNILVVEKN